MASRLEKFVFPDRMVYDWDAWLDGSVWALTAGEDFSVDIKTMRTAAFLAAKARGLKVRTSNRGGSDQLVVQAYKPEPDDSGVCWLCSRVPEGGGRCAGCGAWWGPDERGTLQRL